MANVEFTAHASNRMAERDITEEWVLRTIASPDRTDIKRVDEVHYFRWCGTQLMRTAFTCSAHKKEAAMSSTRDDLVKRLNEALTELHLLWRKERSKSMDVFLRQKIEEYGSDEMLGKLLHDVEHEIHQRKKA